MMGDNGLSAREVGRYEDFLRSSVDWLWETDATLALTHVSSPVALKLGLPAQILIGRPLLGLGRFEPVRSPDQRAESAIAARRPFRDAVFVMTGSEGREVAYRLSGVPYFDEETGNFSGFRGTAMSAAADRADGHGAQEAAAEDAQALSQTLEETLLREHDLSWRLSRLKEVGATDTGEDQRKAQATELSLARSAHELRTPLNAIVGYADLALKQMFGPLGERYLDCFRSIREAGRHLNNLVSQLQTGDLAPGAEGLAQEIIDVSTVAAQAKAMVALAAKKADVDISRVGPLAGGRIVGDRMACTQILVNLLTNAIKFTPVGGSVGLETLVGADNHLQIAVWDTGIGIPEDEQTKIFEPSYRASSVSGEPGFGLGLAISRDLARAMGGDIMVSSQPGQGARFILSLPLAAEPDTGNS